MIEISKSRCFWSFKDINKIDKPLKSTSPKKRRPKMTNIRNDRKLQLFQQRWIKTIMNNFLRVGKTTQLTRYFSCKNINWKIISGKIEDKNSSCLKNIIICNYTFQKQYPWLRCLQWLIVLNIYGGKKVLTFRKQSFGFVFFF